MWEPETTHERQTNRRKKANRGTRKGQAKPGGVRGKQKDQAARGRVRRTRAHPGGQPARRGQEGGANANTQGTLAWRPPTCKGRCGRPHEAAPVHQPSPLSNDRRYRKPDGSVTGSTHANHRSARSPRLTPEGPARDKPIAGPQAVRGEGSPAPLPRRGPAAGTMNPVIGRPPRAPRSQLVKLGAQAPGQGKGTTAYRKPTRAPRAASLEEARGTTWGHEARQRGTPPATTKAH